MRKARVILENIEALYHVNNTIAPSLPDLNDWEQKQLEKDIFDTAEFCHIDIMAYTIWDRGYIMLIRIPEPFEINEDILVKKVEKYYGPEQGQIYNELRKNPSSEKFITQTGNHRNNLFDLKGFARLYGQKFSRSYNRAHHRKGRVWRQRFISFVVEDNSDVLVGVTAHIHTRPVVFNKKKFAFDCTFSSWPKALANNKKWRKIYLQIAGERHWKLAKQKYELQFKIMEDRIYKPHTGSPPEDLMEEYLRKNRMSPEKLRDRKKHWQKMFTRLKKYVQKNDHFLFPRNSPKHRELLTWVRQQRAYYRKGGLSKEHYQSLDTLGFPWNAKTNILKDRPEKGAKPSAQWMENLTILKKQFKLRGDLRPPYHNKKISHWLSYQRAMRKKERLSSSQIEMLDALKINW